MVSFRATFCVSSIPIGLYPFSYVTASTFHHKIGQHDAAYNNAFHDSLIKQLSAVRDHSNPSLVVPSTSASKVEATRVPLFSAATSSVTFANGSTSSFQIYLNSTLPTTPPPPATCASALTAIVQCNSTVPLMSVNPFLLNNDLSTVCSSTCTASLASYRANVVSSCAGYDISTSNVTYPPTYIVDSIVGPYEVQCLQDPTNSQFCNPLLASFNATGGLLALPTSQLCTFCTLETLNITLSNPTTYSIPLAGLLSSAVGICGSGFTSYNFTSSPISGVTPGSGAQFGVNSSVTPTVDCSLVGRNITATAATNCSSLAAQYSVSDYNVLASNPFLSASCSIAAGTQLCVPQPCQTYAIAVNDTCNSVAALAGSKTGTNITTTQLQSFNPELGTFCQLMAQRVGRNICLTPNGGFPTVAATSVGNPSAIPTKAAPIPTPTVNGTTSNCGRYYQVQAGDICNAVALNNSISLPDFILLNSEINSNCTNLWLGYYYCVEPYPPLTSVSASPIVTTNYSTATMITYPVSSMSPTLTTIDITAAGVPAPTNVANGTRTIACGYYYDVMQNDTLNSIAATVGVNSTELITWNPELQNAPPVIGSALCVLFPIGNYTLPAEPTPSNIAPNTTTDCAQFYTVQTGDGCSSIETKFGISDSLFMILNPGLTAQCTNLVLGDAYCVFPTTPPSNNAGSRIPPNLAPGTITSGCTQYYTVVSGDSCFAIETNFNLTTAQFISMNPEITTSCNNLVLEEAYCVQSSNSTIGPPSNLATGSLQNCTAYHTVVSGDNCPALETTFNIAAADFLRWNPQINITCTQILVGSAYCVGGGGLACQKLYTVKSGDFCSLITSSQNITQAQLTALNPQILDANCDNLIVGENLCVG